MLDKWKMKWFSRNVEELKQPMYGLAIGIMKNREDAEDAMQNALILAYEHLDELSMMEKFRPWIMRILTNECFRMLKKRRYHTDIEVRPGGWKTGFCGAGYTVGGGGRPETGIPDRDPALLL